MPQPHDQEVSICVLDADPLGRAGLVAVLGADRGLTVTLATDDVEVVLDGANAAAMDLVIVTDENLGETIAGLLVAHENIQSIVIVDDAPHSLQRLLRADVRGLVSRDTSVSELVEAVHCVAQGKPFVSTSLLPRILDDYREVSTSETAPGHSLILQTKLHRPNLPSDFLPRPRLVQLLEKGQDNPLTLVSAPAGYGKSSAVSHWLESSDWRSAWISLDDEDSDLSQFLGYLGTAIESLGEGVGQNVLALGDSAEQLPMVAVVRIVSNELDAIAEPVILVLDDYHRIAASSTVHDLVTQLLLHPPLSLHLVIVTRRDPPLPLVSLRAKAQITELRMLDLMFSKAESLDLMGRISDFKPTPADETRLGNLLEGWGAGLRLAALALRRSAKPAQLLQDMEIGAVEIRSYLLHEVVESLDESMQGWLLASSITSRFCAGLCEAICQPIGSSDTPHFEARSFLRSLTEQNLFVITLDDKGEWFRFHHEFQDLLLSELSRRVPAQDVVDMRVRAGNWFAAQGLVQEAIEQYLAGRQPERAAQVVAENCLVELNQDRDGLVRRWLVTLPLLLWGRHLEILIAASRLAAVVQSEPEKVEQYMETAAALIEQQGGTSPPWFISESNYLEGVVLYWLGQTPASRQRLEASLRDIPQRQGVLEGDRHFFLALATHADGDPQLAMSRLIEADRSNSDAPVILRFRFVFAISALHLLSGDLVAARMQAHRLRAMSLKDNAPSVNVGTWGDYMVGVSFLHQGSFQQAIVYLERFMAYRYRVEAQVLADAHAALALSYQMSGDATAADRISKLLWETAEEQQRDTLLRKAQASSARLALLRGDIHSAEEMLVPEDEALVPTDMFLWSEVPALTHVRVLLAIGSTAALAKARVLVEKLREQFESWHFSNQVIEAMALQSLVLHKLNRDKESLRVLDEVLPLATRGGWLRPFIEAGAPMVELLQRVSPSSRHAEFVAKVLHAMQVDASQPEPSDDKPLAPVLIEPLTRRELEVLGLLQRRLQNKEIASHLHVSVETVKTHLKHLYDKLGVGSRREAVQKAAGLLPAPVE